MSARSAPSAGPARPLTNLVLLALSLGLFLALGEGLMRVLGGVRYGGWGDPAAIHLVQKQYFANSRGLREREIDYAREPGEFRILCLGDSFTWGQMVPANAAYPKVLERALAVRGGRSYTTINAGRLGWNTEYEARWLRSEGIKYRPQVVMVGFFLNDAEVEHYALKRLLPEALERRLSWSYFYFFLKYRIHMLRVRFGLAQSYTDYLLSLYEEDSEGWKECRSALSSISSAAASINARVLVLILPAIFDWDNYPFHSVHRAVAEFCRNEGIAVVDLLDTFRASSRPWRELRVGPNDEHPNAEGHRLIADAALDALRRFGMLPAASENEP